MTKKPVIISGIATAISFVFKQLGSAISAKISSVYSSIAGAAPVNSGGFFGTIKYGLSSVGYGLRKGTAAAVTLPMKGADYVCNLLGKLFIPLLIITIILLIVTILAGRAKKRAIQKAREKREEASASAIEGVSSNLSSVFNRLR